MCGSVSTGVTFKRKGINEVTRRMNESQKFTMQLELSTIKTY